MKTFDFVRENELVNPLKFKLPLLVALRFFFHYDSQFIIKNKNKCAILFLFLCAILSGSIQTR